MSIFKTKEEESVYKALLQSKDLSVVALAKKTKLHRPKLYIVLKQLIEDSLVETKNEGKRLVYNASSYEVLEKKIERVTMELHEDANTLLSLANGIQSVTSIQTRDDISSMWDNVTKTLGVRGDYYSFTTSTPAANPGKERLDIFRKNIANKDLWSHVLTDKPIDQKKGVRFNLEIKQVTATNLEQDCLWLTYADTYAFVDYANNTGYVIKDKRLAKFQQEIFKLLYKKI